MKAGQSRKRFHREEPCGGTESPRGFEQTSGRPWRCSGVEPGGTEKAGWGGGGRGGRGRASRREMGRAAGCAAGAGRGAGTDRGGGSEGTGREALGAAQVSCSEPPTACTCGLGVARAGRRCGRSRFRVTSRPGRLWSWLHRAERAEGPGSPRACKLPGTEPGGRLAAWFHDWNVLLPRRYVTDPPPPCPCWQSRGGGGGETPNQRSPGRKAASVGGRARCPCRSPVWGGGEALVHGGGA